MDPHLFLRNRCSPALSAVDRHRSPSTHTTNLAVFVADYAAVFVAIFKCDYNNHTRIVWRGRETTMTVFPIAVASVARLSYRQEMERLALELAGKGIGQRHRGLTNPQGIFVRYATEKSNAPTPARPTAAQHRGEADLTEARMLQVNPIGHTRKSIHVANLRSDALRQRRWPSSLNPGTTDERVPIHWLSSGRRSGERGKSRIHATAVVARGNHSLVVQQLISVWRLPRKRR
jgi:hypothetical protein